MTRFACWVRTDFHILGGAGEWQTQRKEYQNHGVIKDAQIGRYRQRIFRSARNAASPRDRIMSA
jgi:hypothetical protein